MQYILQVHGDDHYVRHVEATSAEDALRQLRGATPERPVRATFLPADADYREATRYSIFRRRYRGENSRSMLTAVLGDAYR
jgi:hypothetical protein